MLANELAESAKAHMGINNHIVIIPRPSDHERLLALQERALRVKCEDWPEFHREYEALLRTWRRETRPASNVFSAEVW